MKTLKRFAAVAMAGAMMVGGAMTSMAAEGDVKELTFYVMDEETGEYEAVPHAQMCLDSCVEGADGTYYITFKETTVTMNGMTVTGAISEFEGVDLIYEDGLSTVEFDYDPQIDVVTDEDGNVLVTGDDVSFIVTMYMGDMEMTHPYEDAVVVIE
ncbi:hypothetical protein [Clostridium sp. M62/1]|uniref:hypothetical protein n=1 Tax=Clostridium sp. M62/1 TaxID=411486 RepID=UPI0015B71F9F